MLRLIQKLYRTRLLTPAGLFYLLEAVLTTGINLMALLRIAARLHPHLTAVIDDRGRLTYPQLWQQAESLAMSLQVEYGIEHQQKIAIACINHASAIKAIFAVSRLGAHIFLINPEMSADQIRSLLEHLAINFYIYDHQSEAGFCILGTPALLGRKPASIGQPVWGVRAKIVNNADREVSNSKIGRLCIRSAWSTHQTSWIETGDLAYQDAEGDIFLCGRVDDMIVSGGENVYPIDLENKITQHPDVESAVVFGISNQEFGQRLKAVVVKKQNTVLTPPILQDWLKPRVARYQMPAVIEFRDHLPYTALGKLDMKSLRE